MTFGDFLITTVTERGGGANWEDLQALTQS